MLSPSLLRAYRAWHPFCRCLRAAAEVVALFSPFRSSTRLPSSRGSQFRQALGAWWRKTDYPTFLIGVYGCVPRSQVRMPRVQGQESARANLIDGVGARLDIRIVRSMVPLAGWWHHRNPTTQSERRFSPGPPDGPYRSSIRHLWPSKVSAAPQRWGSGTLIAYKSHPHLPMAPPQPATTGNPSQPRRSREYYIAEGDVIFKVENTIFRVHKYFFYRESAYFQQLFRSPSIPCNDPPGSSETNPVVLKDTTSEAFAGLCWIFYNQKYSMYTTTVEKWVEILALAQKWAFKEVEQLCIREMQKLPIEPVDKIHIYQAFRLDRALLAESFAKLTVRPQPLNLEDGNKLGIETTLQIAQARELSRGSHSGTRTSTIQLNDSELRLVIRDAFALGEEALDFLVDVLQPPQHPENANGSRKPKK